MIELAPGALFAIVLIILGVLHEDSFFLLIVAAGLAAGWLSFGQFKYVGFTWFAAIAIFAIAFVYALVRFT